MTLAEGFTDITSSVNVAQASQFAGTFLLFVV